MLNYTMREKVCDRKRKGVVCVCVCVCWEGIEFCSMHFTYARWVLYFLEYKWHFLSRNLVEIFILGMREKGVCVCVCWECSWLLVWEWNIWYGKLVIR